MRAPKEYNYVQVASKRVGSDSHSSITWGLEQRLVFVMIQVIGSFEARVGFLMQPRSCTRLSACGPKVKQRICIRKLHVYSELQ